MGLFDKKPIRIERDGECDSSCSYGGHARERSTQDYYSDKHHPAVRAPELAEESGNDFDDLKSWGRENGIITKVDNG